MAVNIHYYYQTSLTKLSAKTEVQMNIDLLDEEDIHKAHFLLVTVKVEFVNVARIGKTKVQ